MMSTVSGMAFFWAMLGFMAGIAVAFFAGHLWRASHSAAAQSSGFLGSKRWLLIGIACFLMIAAALYARVGMPTSATQPLTSSNDVAAHAIGANGANANPGAIADVTTKLAAKLAAGGGSDADWQLLQQSYEFLGDSDAAELAKQHRMGVAPNQASPGMASATSTAAPSSLTIYQQRIDKNPNDAAAWLAIAELHRTARDFAKASEAFGHVIKLKAMDADSWADYADVQASMTGSLSNASARQAIAAALKLEPHHAKALWLQASLAYEEKRYAQALEVWQTLRAVIPNGSPDAAIVDANIAEAAKLAGVAKVGNSASVTAAAVQGSVSLDAAIRSQVTSDMTLFIYAKADDSPAPVAAYRGVVSSWPFRFTLDDGNAMMPTRKLSQYATVKLEARLSRSGQAIAHSGDLQADAVTIDTHDGKPVQLTISRRVP